MTADLYQTLGVGKKASRKQIREAYRQKSKAAHPDTGGSAEKFALVKRAHDVLTDDAGVGQGSSSFSMIDLMNQAMAGSRF